MEISQEMNGLNPVPSQIDVGSIVCVILNSEIRKSSRRLHVRRQIYWQIGAEIPSPAPFYPQVLRRTLIRVAWFQ